MTLIRHKKTKQTYVLSAQQIMLIDGENSRYVAPYQNVDDGKLYARNQKDFDGFEITDEMQTKELDIQEMIGADIKYKENGQTWVDCQVTTFSKKPAIQKNKPR